MGEKPPAHHEAECWGRGCSACWDQCSPLLAADPRGNSHPQTWPRPSRLHVGSSPLSTLENPCWPASSFPGDNFSVFPTNWSQEKQNLLTGSHLEAPQCPRLAAALGPVLSPRGLPSALPGTEWGARGQAACACPEGIWKAGSLAADSSGSFS